MKVLNLVTTTDATFYRNQVRSLERSGVECTTLGVPGERSNTEPVQRRTATDYLRFFPQVFRAVNGEYDLVHANFGLTAPHAVTQRDLPVVVTLWGTDVFGQFGWLSRLAVRFADEIIVMSEEMAAAVPGDPTVIPHGVDFEVFRPMDRDAARAELDWDPSAHYVLFPYPIARGVKNYPRTQRLVEAAEERLSRPVHLYATNGEVPHAGMPVYFNAADAMVLVSGHEGSPNTVKEALACNLPVVATDVGDVARRLDGVTPSAVGRSDEEIVDGLVRVLESGERSNGREQVRGLSVERTGEKVRAVYERALAP